jgi:hypothetical protein
MSQSGWKATTAASDLEVASVARLQGYLGMLDAILGVCRQAEREGKMGSQARCKAMLADCREHVCGHLKRMEHTIRPHGRWGLPICLRVSGRP